MNRPCALCGHSQPDRATRGPLTTQVNPPKAWWRGKPLSITPSQTRLLHLLCQVGQASHFAVELASTGDDCTPGTAKTVVHYLRRRLPPEVTIKAISGWGYRLDLSTEAPAQRSNDNDRSSTDDFLAAIA